MSRRGSDQIILWDKQVDLLGGWDFASECAMPYVGIVSYTLYSSGHWY